MNLCELVRSEFNHDREFCLYPLRYHDGLVQACTIAYNQTLTINLRFFNDKYEFQVWINTENNNEIIYQPSGNRKKCFMIDDFILNLIQHSKEAAMIMIYSLFFKAKRLISAAADAADAAYDAAAAAADAAYDAAADAAYAAAAAAAAYVAAAAAAYVADAAADAADAAYDADAKKRIRKALKYLFKYRKELMKK